MGPSWKVAISYIKTRVWRFAAGTPLTVVRSVYLGTKIRQRLAGSRILPVKNLTVIILKRTEFILANVKSIPPRKQMIHIRQIIQIRICTGFSGMGAFHFQNLQCLS